MHVCSPFPTSFSTLVAIFALNNGHSDYIETKYQCTFNLLFPDG